MEPPALCIERLRTGGIRARRSDFSRFPRPYTNGIQNIAVQVTLRRVQEA